MPKDTPAVPPVFQRSSRRLIPAVVILAAAVAVPAWGQSAGHPAGTRLHIRFQDLPQPYAEAAASNPPQRVERPDGVPIAVPPGFTATLFADDVDNARNLLPLPDGSVLVAQQRPGTLMRLHDRDGDGRSDTRSVWAAGFDRPFGLAFYNDAVWVGDVDGIWRLPWKADAAEAAGDRRRITPPGALGPDEGHSTRSLAIAPDGRTLYVGVGSRSNIGEEPEPRATVLQFAADGSRGRVFAAGLRNPVGIAFHPGTGALYTVVNERDGLGDRLVPDYLTQVRDGAFYGWPYAYLGPHPQPRFADKRPDKVKATIAPDVLFEAHSAPIGLTFGTGLRFPERYRQGAFVGMHGSWNRSSGAGYHVAFVPFENGKPTGGYEVFAAGFQRPTPARQRPRVWGRPAGVAVAGDGSLLIADSFGAVWRVAWAGTP